MFITNTLKNLTACQKKLSLKKQVSAWFLLKYVNQNRVCLNQSDSQNELGNAETATWQFN